MTQPTTNRRDFLRATGAVTAAAAIGGSVSTAAAQQATASGRQTIGVNHEWGALKEVVVGNPNVIFPTRLNDAARSYLPESAIEYIDRNAGQALEDGDPERHERFVEQVDAIIDILKDRDIVVHQVEKHLPHELEFLKHLDDSTLQTFPRDPMLVIGNKFIETALFGPYRRKDKFAIRRTIGERLENSNAQVVSMPEPPPYPADENGKYGPGPFLEGGDVMLVGHDIYVGNTGNASNAAGIQWLQECLGEEYRVQEIPLSSHFLHLDCVLALPRPGLAIICRDGFVEGVPEFLKDWKLIDVSAEDAEQKLGCNALVLDEKTAIVGADMPQLADALDAEGTEVLTAAVDAIYWQGGAFRCWHHPLVRMSSL